MLSSSELNLFVQIATSGDSTVAAAIGKRYLLLGNGLWGCAAWAIINGGHMWTWHVMFLFHVVCPTIFAWFYVYVYVYIYIYIWLVVSNTFFFHNKWDIPSHWRTHIFQDGYCTTNVCLTHWVHTTIFTIFVDWFWGIMKGSPFFLRLPIALGFYTYMQVLSRWTNSHQRYQQQTF